VTLIVKDCAERLAVCLQSLRSRFLRFKDELLVLDTGSRDDGATVKVARQFGARVIERPDLCHEVRPLVEKWIPEHLAAYEGSSLVKGCLLDFAEARQIVTDAAAHNVQFWVDSDDELIEAVPGRLRDQVDRIFSEGVRDAIFLDYHYATEKDGSVSSILKRERIFDRRVYRWKGKCHETAIPIGPCKGAAYFVDLQSALRHHRDHLFDNRSSDIRNYVIIRNEIENDQAAGRVPDTRSLFYLGNAARGLGRFSEALTLYKELIEKSGSRDDRFSAAYYCGLILNCETVRRPWDALEWFERCIRLKAEDPRGYFGVARAYYLLGRYDEAIHWFKIGKGLPEPTQSLHNYNPLHVHAVPYHMAALAYKELGLQEEAKGCVEHLMHHFPNHPDTECIKVSIGNWIAERGLVDSVRRLIANSRAENPDKAVEVGRAIVARLPAVPDEIECAGLAKLEPEDARGGKELVIWCGKAPEPWGPHSGESGIGGSEKAVIQMAPRLQHRGFKVTVYTNVPSDQRGVDSKSGVNWQHFGSYDKSRPRETAIFWRAPEMLEIPFPIRRRVVWCHDVQSADRWTPVRQALADQVWVLSKAHAATLGPVAEQLGKKLVITRNGIDADLFRTYCGKVARDTKKVVYASSPDRGVLTAIKLFQAANVPGSTLHVFYGFTKLFLKFAKEREYGGIPDLGRDGNYYEYQAAVMKAVDEDERIVWRGRVGWEDLAKEFCGAGVWLYPTRFYEISCMAAMEAQAAGCIPVATRHAALEETVFAGPVLHLSDPEPAQALVLRTAIETGLGADRTRLHEEACRRFDYDTLADEWCVLLKE
jgi:tetratricopeptide (TPR) repeat protein/glycosyltransferase involved in cell wall biosynthesis